MKCPNDARDLAAANRDSIEVDECPECGGTWFQREELRRAKDSADADLQWLDFDVFADDASFMARSGERPCPECSASMNSLAYMSSEVVVDACPSDHGVWLDAGEFKRIVEHLETIVVQIDAGEYRRRRDGELQEVVSGPESRMSELRDFLTAVRAVPIRGRTSERRDRLERDYGAEPAALKARAALRRSGTAVELSMATSSSENGIGAH